MSINSERSASRTSAVNHRSKARAVGGGPQPWVIHGRIAVITFLQASDCATLFITNWRYHLIFWRPPNGPYMKNSGFFLFTRTVRQNWIGRRRRRKTLIRDFFLQDQVRARERVCLICMRVVGARNSQIWDSHLYIARGTWREKHTGGDNKPC